MGINFAIIGCGRIAKRHAEQIKKYGNLVSVCDIDEVTAKEFGEHYQCRFYTSAEVMLMAEAEVDVVSVCTPNGLHAEHSIMSMKAGKHVLCEKPLATSSADAKKMIAISVETERKLFVVKQNRYNPPVMAVKELLDKDDLGNIFSFQINCFWNRPEAYYKNSWKGTKRLDGGSLFTQFSHFVDLLYWLLGDVKIVKSMTGNFEHPIIEIEDTGVVIIEMLNGALGTLNYTVNSFGQNMEGSFTFFGEKGTVKIGGQYLNELEYQHIKDQETINISAGNSANNYGFYQGSMSNHDKVYENLIKVLQNDSHAFATAYDGLKTVEIIEKIYNAALLK
jgi:UDP-N-acetyl-2-amino-2-deoxyglucuronate dehydrogenase